MNENTYLCDECFCIKYSPPPKKSIWYEIKKFSYFVLLLGTPGLVISLIYGWKVQVIFYIAIIIGQINSLFIDWLMEKF